MGGRYSVDGKISQEVDRVGVGVVHVVRDEMNTRGNVVGTQDFIDFVSQAVIISESNAEWSRSRSYKVVNTHSSA